MQDDVTIKFCPTHFIEKHPQGNQQSWTELLKGDLRSEAWVWCHADYIWDLTMQCLVCNIGPSILVTSLLTHVVGDSAMKYLLIAHRNFTSYVDYSIELCWCRFLIGVFCVAHCTLYICTDCAFIVYLLYVFILYLRKYFCNIIVVQIIFTFIDGIILHSSYVYITNCAHITVFWWKSYIWWVYNYNEIRKHRVQCLY